MRFPLLTCPRCFRPATCLLLVIASNLWQGTCAADDDVSSLAARIANGESAERLEAIRDVAELGPAGKVAVPQLISALESNDLPIQYEAAKALAAIGPDGKSATEALKQLLAADHELARYAAASALRQIVDGPDGELIERLRKLAADDESLAVRVAAARTAVTLAAHGDAEMAAPVDLQVLIAGLASADNHTASDAMLGLATVGESATESIVPLLGSDDAIAQANAANALAILGLGAHTAEPALLKALPSASADAQRHLLRALAAVSTHPENAVPPILAVLNSDAALGTKVAALHALGEFGPDARSAVASVVELLNSDNPRVRLEAVETLGEIGPAAEQACPNLVAALQDADGLITIEAANALSRIGTGAVEPLTSLLKDPNYEVLAATILGDIGPAAAPAVPNLVQLLDSDESDARRAALLAIAGIGPGASSAADKLLEILNGTNEAARPGAAYALARIGAQQATPALKKVLAETDDERLQLATAWALVMLNPEAPEAEQAVPVLQKGLADPWELVRRECIVALAAIGPGAQSSAEALMGLLDDPDPQVRAEALIALPKVNADVQQLLPRLVQGLQDEDLQTRYASAFVLGHLGEQAKLAVPPLKQMLNHRRDFDRVVAAWALVKIDPTPANKHLAVPLLVAAIEHPAETVRQEAATTLGELGDSNQSILDALRRASEDPSPKVQQAAKASLKSLSGT